MIRVSARTVNEYLPPRPRDCQTDLAPSPRKILRRAPDPILGGLHHEYALATA